MEKYREMYQESVDKPEKFWSKIASEFHWKKQPEPGKFLEYNFDASKGPISIKWMPGALTNVCYNVLDVNIKEKVIVQQSYFPYDKTRNYSFIIRMTGDS